MATQVRIRRRIDLPAALEVGESHERFVGLAAWRESPYFTERERAAIALRDAITLLREGHVQVWSEASRHVEASE